MITIRARPSGGSQRRGAHHVSQNASTTPITAGQVGPAGGEVVLADDTRQGHGRAQHDRRPRHRPSRSRSHQRDRDQRDREVEVADQARRRPAEAGVVEVVGRAGRQPPVGDRRDRGDQAAHQPYHPHAHRPTLQWPVYGRRPQRRARASHPPPAGGRRRPPVRALGARVRLLRRPRKRRRDLRDRAAAAERDRRAAHGPRAERLDPGRADAAAPDARAQHALDLRHRPRRRSPCTP